MKKLIGAVALLGLAMTAPALAAKTKMVGAADEEMAIQKLMERNDNLAAVRPVRVFFYGSARNLNNVIPELEKQGWYNIRFYDGERPAFVVATRATTAEREAIMGIGSSLRQMASAHSVRLEAFEIPPAKWN